MSNIEISSSKFCLSRRNHETIAMEDTDIAQREKISHCRFCAQEKKCEELLDLNIDTETQVFYLTILEFLKIDFIDMSHSSIPKTTCESCYNTMVQCYNFFQNVKESQNILCELYGAMIENDENQIEIQMGSEELIKTEIVSESQVNENTEETENSVDWNIINQSQFEQDEKYVPNSEDLKNIDNESNGNLDLIDNNICVSNIASEVDNDIDNKSTNSNENCDNASICSPANEVDNFTTTYCGIPIFDEEEAMYNNDNNQNQHINATLTVDEVANAESKTESIQNENKDDENKDDENKDASWITYQWICKHCEVEWDSMEDLRSHAFQLHRKCYAFKCVDCDGLLFHSFNSFIEHARQHRNYLRLYCPHCNENFKSASDCSDHTLIHWSNGQKICDWCGEIFPSESELKLHKSMSQIVKQPIKLKQRVPRLVATICKSSIHEFEDESHTKSDFWTWDDYQWTCRECLLRFPSAQLLRTHTQEMHSKCFSMKCIDCAVEVRTYKQFVMHVIAHRPYLKRHCPYCNKHLKTKEFQRHLNGHLESSPKPCYECGQIFESKLLASQHCEKFKSLSRHLTTEELTCDVCKFVAKCLSQLRTHKNTHDKNSKKECVCLCDTCGKQFYTNGALKSHLVVHAHAQVQRDRNHICKLCDKGFLTKHLLQIHVRSHLKKFKCDYCSKLFTSKCDIQKHIERMHMHTRTVNKIYEHKCQICSKRLSTKSNLRQHMNMHSGTKPYKCQQCEKTFTNWSNCNKHMVRIHNTTLAKTKLTSQGRIAFEKLEKVSNMAAGTEQWMQEVVKSKKKYRK